jgi:tRNA 5-methylaminomethyl-2-thiouridine biosynthesis bifunctional protein
MIRIRPAHVAFAEDGNLYAPDFGDVYASRSGAVEQAQAVFLAGNGFAQAWQGRSACTILELGFGTGVNFLATWAAWREHAPAGARLHYVSVEAFPLRAEDLRAALAAALARHPPLAALAECLLAQWPPLATGLHRLRFEDGRLALTLVLRDVSEALPQLRLQADAFYLDGFAPRRNEAMWAEPVLRGLARLAAPQATLATWCAAGHLRRGLSAAGFAVESRPGYGGKREMTVARYAPPYPVRGRAAAAPPPNAPGRAIVIGAGIAGAAVARRLAEDGWSVEVLDRAAEPAAETSGNPAAHAHMHVSADDALLSRLTRAGVLLLMRRCAALEQAGRPVVLAGGGFEWMDEPPALPDDLATLLAPAPGATPPGLGSSLAGLYWNRAALSLRPPALVRALLDHPRVAFRGGADVLGLERAATGWLVRVDGVAALAADAVVLANGLDAARLIPGADGPDWPVQPVQGQISYLPMQCLPVLDAALCGPAYLLPAVDGSCVAGATYDEGNTSLAVTTAAHRANLEQLSAMLAPQAAQALLGLDPQGLTGRSGVRAVARDRLPMIGAVPDFAAVQAAAARVESGGLPAVPRLPGLFTATAYASRGFTWALLAAELLADQLAGAPPPIEGDLADAIDPGRFAVRRLRNRS